MIKENRVKSWVNEAYKLAIESGVDMLQATAAIEELRALMATEEDPFIYWNAFDRNIGKAESGELTGLLKKLRLSFKDNIISEEKEWLSSIDLGVPLVWNSWLRKIGKALAHWRIDLCLTLLNVGAVPLEKQIHTARINEKILLLNEQRWTEGYSILRELASYDCIDVEDRLSILLLGASVWIFELELPEEALSWIADAKKLGVCPERVLDIEGTYFLARSEYKLAKEKFYKAIEIPGEKHLAELHLGDLFLAQNQLEEAQNWYEKGLRRIPGHSETYLRLIKFFARPEHNQLQIGKIPEIAYKAMDVVPEQSYGFMLAAGDAFLANGRVKTALEWFSRAEEQYPTRLLAKLKKGQAYLSKQNFNKAEEIFQDLIEEFPKSYEGYGALAWSKELQGGWDDALAYYEKVSAIRQEWDFSIRKRMADVKLNKLKASYTNGSKESAYFQKLSELEDEFIKLFKEDQKDLLLLDQLDTLADLYLDAKELNKAIQIYERITELAAKDIRADYENSIGNIYYELGDFKKASQYYQLAITRKADNAAFYSNLGLSAEKEGNLAFAKEQYGKALNLAPKQATYLNNLGLIHLKENEFEKASYFFRTAIESSKGVAAFYENLAIACELSGKPEEAEKHYEQAVTLEPENPGYLNNLGLIKEYNQKDEEALAYFNKASALSPDSAVYLANAAKVLARLGRYEDAESKFLSSMSIEKDQADVHHNLGVVYTYLSRYEEACEQIEKAIVLSPKNAVYLT
ncbi:MAG: tetratricopeptide repeat protein, partial [Bacteroidota bacterium]